MYIPLLVSVLTSLVINYGEATACSNEGKVCFYGGVLSVTSRYTDYVTNSLGLAVEIISPSNWLLMTTEDFAKCNAIVFSDPTCSSDESRLDTAESNSAVWSAAVDGNILLLGTDEDYHWTQGGTELIQNGLSFVTDNSYCTSLYVSFSCYYFRADSVTVPLLDYFGTFIMSGQRGCPDDVHIIEDHDLIHNVHELTDDTLSHWGCSVHEVFDSFNSYPPEFTPLAIAIGQGDNEEFPDGTFGAAYILVNNPGPKCYDTEENSPTAENIALEGYYFPSCSRCCDFIQCDDHGQAFLQTCGPGTYWTGQTCGWNYGECTDDGCTVFGAAGALQVHDNPLINNVENKSYNYYGGISLIGLIVFILINNIFIGCWCLRKNRNNAYVKCDMISVNDEI